MSYRLRLLGRFSLLSPSGDGISISSKKNQALIAMLALANGEPVLRSKLCALLWEDRGEDQARSSLRQAFTALRKVFAPHDSFPFAVTEDDASILVEEISVDTQALINGELAGTPNEVYPGECLDGLNLSGSEIEHWLLGERRRFSALYCNLMAKQIANLEGEGRLSSAALAAHSLLKADPLDESAHRAIMRAFVENGEPAKALQQYQVCHDALTGALRLSPAAETQKLADQIRSGAMEAGHGMQPRRPVPEPLEVPDKPSIAVLPFVNLSGDPEQEYFADGITENIITDLSRFHDLLVIARNSTFAYKGKAVRAQDVSRELAARYIIEGSVQRSADRVRITAQLIDGHTGGHLWAERYDRQLEDMFAVQDDVTEMIIGTLASGYGGRLRKAIHERVEKKQAQNFQAFDCFMRGLDSFTFNKQETRRAGELFEEAIRLDPKFTKAYAKLAWVHIIDADYGWSDDYEGSLAKGLEIATRAIECDDGDSWAHWALAGYYWSSGRHDLAIIRLEKALELNPSDADVRTDMGLCLSYAGRAKEGLEHAHKAMRINRHHPQWYQMQLGQIYHDARQYEDAVAIYENLRGFETAMTGLYLAASRAALGQTDRAEEAIARVLDLDPLATLEKWANIRLAPYAAPEDLAHFRENLRKAGLPD